MFNRVNMRKPKRRRSLGISMLMFILMQLMEASADTTCAAGSYLKAGSASAICRQCEPGHYCVGGTKTSMVACAPGTYSQFGASSCTLCPAGFACADPAVAPVPCGPQQGGSGYECTYSGVGASSCTVWTPPAGCSSTASCADATHICTSEGTLEAVSPGQVGNYLAVAGGLGLVLP